MRNFLTSVLMGAILAVGGSLASVPGALPASVASAVGSTEVAAADRREVRRTARRVVRRTTRRAHRYYHYIHALPPGCVTVIVNRIKYWRCGGIHYEQAKQDGTTVFIVVNP